MPSRRNFNMASSRSVPKCLNPISSTTVEDPFLTESDFTEAWGYFEPDIPAWVRAALARVSLHLAERAAAGSDGAHHHLLANVGTVRTALRADRQFVSDLVQEVRIAMWTAIRRNTSDPTAGLRGSLHVVRAWLRTTIRFIVKSHSVRPATLLFAAGPMAADDEHDDSCSAEPVCNLSPALLVERARLLDELSANLSDKHLHVVRGLFAGYSYAELADQLGVTESYTRGLFHRAKKKMVELLSARDGPQNGDVPEGDDIGSTQRQTTAHQNRNQLISLTSSLFRATIRTRSKTRTFGCHRISRDAALNPVLDRSVEGFRGRLGKESHPQDAKTSHERLQRSAGVGRILEGGGARKRLPSAPILRPRIQGPNPRGVPQGSSLVAPCAVMRPGKRTRSNDVCDDVSSRLLRVAGYRRANAPLPKLSNILLGFSISIETEGIHLMSKSSVSPLEFFSAFTSLSTGGGVAVATGGTYTHDKGAFYLRINTTNSVNSVIAIPRSTGALRSRPPYHVVSRPPGGKLNKHAALLCGQPFSIAHDDVEGFAPSLYSDEREQARIADALERYIRNDAIVPGSPTLKHRFGTVLTNSRDRYLVVSSNAALHARQSDENFSSVVSVIEVSLPRQVRSASVKRRGSVAASTEYCDENGITVAQAHLDSLNTIDLNYVNWTVDKAFVPTNPSEGPPLCKALLDQVTADIVAYCRTPTGSNHE